MVNPMELKQLIDYYKGEITENTLFQKAARLAAEADLISRNKNIPAGIAVAKLKPLMTERNKIIRQLKGTGRLPPPPPTKSIKRERVEEKEPVKPKRRRKTEPERLRPLSGWEDWAEGKRSRTRQK